jgi:hypothetical protein
MLKEELRFCRSRMACRNVTRKKCCRTMIMTMETKVC